MAACCGTISFAGIILTVSAIFALAMIITMAGLVWRRYRAEKTLIIAQQGDIVLSREILGLVAAHHDDAWPTTLRNIPSEHKQRVFSHLMQLMRGEERVRLLELADASDVTRPALAHLTHRRAARRVDAMRSLEQFPTPNVVKALHRTMGEDKDMVVRLEAAAVLARIDHLPPPANVVTMLGLGTQLPNRLHEALFRTSAARHCDQLIVMAADLNLGPIRPLLVEALGWSSDYNCLATLAIHARDVDPEIRAASMRAARHLGHPGAAKFVLPLLLDPVDHVRVQAVRTCSKLELRDAVPLLLSLAQNASWWVRMRATEALLRLRPPPSSARQPVQS